MESAAQSILSKFGPMLVEELQEIRGVGSKVVHLRDELATMNALLRVISEAEEGSVDHLVREWEKQVHDLAYDAEDCIDTYSLGMSCPAPLPPTAGTTLTNWARYLLARAKRNARYHYEKLVLRRNLEFHPLLEVNFVAVPPIFSWARYLLARAEHIARYPYDKIVLQRALAADIRDLLARATAVSERRARYGIDRAALNRSAWLAPVSAASLSANALRPADDPGQFVGIEKDANDLAGKIKAPGVHEGLNIFSIVGFGGLDQTTLAMELCRQLDADFPRQALVSVSQAFNAEKDIKGLLVRVLQQILKKKVDDEQTHGNELQIDQMEVEELSIKIKELLKQTRCLIVVDDVWSLQAWEAIRNRLPEKNYGSRIIVTTRIEAVAKAASVSEDSLHRMKPLGQEDSEKLFVKRVFGSPDKDTCPTKLKDIMDTIFKKCGGLPLAIISIASLLASYRSVEGIEMWKRVSKSIGSQMESHPNLEGMRRLITLSYDYLPHHLKACMMYLSIFPEDYVIAKHRLLYRWTAEGLVTEKRGLTLLEVAEEYFNELISRNMIQLDKLELEERNGSRVQEVEGCRVHDMILEVMVSKSQESTFVSLVGRQYGGMPHAHGKVRRLSIHDNDHEEQHQARSGIETMKVHHVRSLSTFQSDDLNKLVDRLEEFKLLRVLDLEDCKALQNKHMRDVCRLYLLRFLSLRGTNVSVMPDKVGNLEHLETLDIKNTHMRREMPLTVTKLSKLVCLRSDSWLLPRGIGKMKALREVDTAVLTGDDVVVAQEIGELPELKVLSILIRKERRGELDEEFMRALHSSLRKTSALRSLHLEHIEYDGIGGYVGSLEFLLGVSTPPALLQCLSMKGRISQLPDWISSLTHLTKFEVEHTKLVGDQLFDVLCKLPNLQSVHPSHYSYEGPELVAHKDHFPVLRILEVSATRPIVLKFEEGSMRKLETLVLGFNDEEMSLVGVENLKNLIEVNLYGDEDNMAMVRAVEQLKALSTESNPIKVVVDYWW